jgi:predicted RNA-binding protein YlqC (UPF0109 family)
VANQLKELVEVMARSLADSPEQIQVKEIGGGRTSIFQVRMAKEDLGQIIGKEGRNANALRTILSAVAIKLRKTAILEILE